MIKNSSLDEDTKRKKIPTSSIISRIYGSPKIHKEGIPLRPIVNTIGSPNIPSCQIPHKKNRPLYGNSSYYVKDSTYFTQCLKNIDIKNEDILISFDTLIYSLTNPLK